MVSRGQKTLFWRREEDKLIIHDKQSNVYYEDEIVFIEAFGKRIKYLFDCGGLYSCKIVNGKLVDDRPLTQEDMDVILEVAK